MGLMDSIKAQAKELKKRIVLPEGADERVVVATSTIAKEGLANVTLLGDEDVIVNHAKKAGVSLEGVCIVNPETGADRQKYADLLFELRKEKGMTEEEAWSTVAHPMYYATLMVKAGDVDGMVGGALCTTADTMRPGLQIIKTAPGISTVSSCFIMQLPNHDYGQEGLMLFGDCAINIDPTPEQLADIAIATAKTAKVFFGFEPDVAMLSFSTKGSAKGEQVNKVVEAVKIAKANAPEINIDGELQADAALSSVVAKLKAPDSSVAGKANVLIFPDLQSGNIGYKLVQRLAGAEAIGPLCQGFAKPINDLSRGCSMEDIVNLVAITSIQASK